MHVIEIFLPLQRNDGSSQQGELFVGIRNELLQRFGGLTAYTRAPAEGLWQSRTGDFDEDVIIIFEVMAETLDRSWWTRFRESLERQFNQESILIRASAVEQL